MDYKASKSGFKKIKRVVLLKKKWTILEILLYVLLLVPQHSYADDPTPNPLTENVTISATVLQNPNSNPSTPPLGSPGNTNPLTITDVAIFKGIAYQGSIVTLLKNGVVLANIPANPDGTFELHLSNLAPGTYSFGLRAEDKSGLKSKLLVFTIFVSTSVTTIVEGIFIPPTITSDKIEVKKGGPIFFSGTTVPNADIRLSLILEEEIIKRVKADQNGFWSYTLDSSTLLLGDYTAKARALTSGDLSPYSDSITVRVGATNRPRSKISKLTGFNTRCDLNNDNRVNLLDFSIMAFWYKRLTFPPKVDLNSDKYVNLTDLSILAYCWTG